jgi:hypothetical protein
MKKQIAEKTTNTLERLPVCLGKIPDTQFQNKLKGKNYLQLGSQLPITMQNLITLEENQDILLLKVKKPFKLVFS